MQTHPATYATPAAAVTAIARDIQAEMAAFMIENGSCTREDLLQHFTPEQVDRYSEGAARDANRRAGIRHC